MTVATQLKLWNQLREWKSRVFTIILVGEK